MFFDPEQSQKTTITNLMSYLRAEEHEIICLSLKSETHFQRQKIAASHHDVHFI